MKAMLLALALAVLAITSVPTTAHEAASSQPTVLLLHGWTRSAADWNTAKAAYEQAGFTVHALALPEDGKYSGDTWTNADHVEEFIAANGLTNVHLDGHSLGGTLVYELIRVRRNPAITSAVTRDSNIQSVANTGLYCWGGIGVPDQCNLAVRQGIMAAPLAGVPVLSLASFSSKLPDVACALRFDLDHMAFASDVAVTAAAIAWARGESPCSGPQQTFTPTPTVSPTSTRTPAATATPTPTPTQTPSACSWWLRLWGMC